MTEFLKNHLTDVVLRLIMLAGGVPLKMKTRYRFMYFTRWEPWSTDRTSPDSYLHHNRVYLREPEWHLDWSSR